MRIVLCYPVEKRHLKQIEAAAPQAEVVDAGQERIADELPQADVFCGHAKVPVPWEEVVQKGRLRWIQSSAAGLDHCLVPPVIDSEIVVSGASGLFANPVAEQAMALLLGLLRSQPPFFRAQQRREFDRLPTNDLHDKTVGIVGFGGNGRRLAEVLVPWNVRILATDLFPMNKPPYVEALWPADRLNDLLEQVDILLLAVPLTEETRGFIDAAALGRMKRGSWLINVARGPVVVEQDMVAALEEGQLSGAGLDVTEVEPLSPESKLWDLPSVMISPHVGAQSHKRYDIVTDFFCDNLRRYQSNQPLLNLVDKKLGFPRPTEEQP